MIKLVTGFYRALTQAEKVPPPEKRMDKIPGRVLGQMCGYLNNRERALLLGSCMTFKLVLENNTPAYKAFRKLLPLITGKCQEILIQNPHDNRRHFPPYTEFSCFDYDPNAQQIITGDNLANGLNGWARESVKIRVKIWDAKTGKLVNELTPHNNTESVLAVRLDTSKNRAFAATKGSNGGVRLWEVKSDKVKEIFSQVAFERNRDELTSVCADLCSDTIFCGSTRGNFVRYNIKEDPSFVERWSHGIRWICDAPEIDRLFTISYRRQKGEQSTLEILDRSKQTCLSTQAAGFSYDSKKIVYDPTEKRLFTHAKTRFIQELDPMTGQMRREFEELEETAELSALHFDSTKKWLFAGFGYKAENDEHRKIVVWNVETGLKLREFVLPEHQKKYHYCVDQIDFDPLTNTVLTAGWGVQLWDLFSKRLIMDILPKRKTCVRWDREHNLLVSFNENIPMGDDCGTLQVFNYAPPNSQAEPESKQEKKAE